MPDQIKTVLMCFKLGRECPHGNHCPLSTQCNALLKKELVSDT